MGRRGDGGNVLLMASQAARNPRVRPRRLRELGRAALDHLWNGYAPPPGSRLQAFRVAFRKVEASARDIGIAADVFAEWADALRFQVDDRDDAVPW